MGVRVVSVSFRHEIISIFERKMPQIDAYLSKSMKLLLFLMQFVYICREIPFKVPTQSTQQRKNELCITFFQEKVAVFASKTLQNDSKGFEIFQHLRFCATRVLFESF